MKKNMKIKKDVVNPEREIRITCGDIEADRIKNAKRKNRKNKKQKHSYRYFSDSKDNFAIE